MIKLKTPNSMEIAGQPAVITYVPELNAFRGKFLGLSGYCDFVSDSIQGLQKEGELSLREYLEDCKAAGIEPYARTEKIKTFTLRYPESLSERLNNAAAQQQVSVNTYIIETLNERVEVSFVGRSGYPAEPLQRARWAVWTNDKAKSQWGDTSPCV